MINVPFERAVPDIRRRLIEHSTYLKDHGMPNAANTTNEAAALLLQFYELHKALSEREAKLTAELVSLRK